MKKTPIKVDGKTRYVGLSILSDADDCGAVWFSWDHERPHSFSHSDGDGGSFLESMPITTSKHAADAFSHVAKLMKSRHIEFGEKLTEGQLHGVVDALSDPFIGEHCFANLTNNIAYVASAESKTGDHSISHTVLYPSGTTRIPSNCICAFKDEKVANWLKDPPEFRAMFKKQLFEKSAEYCDFSEYKTLFPNDADILDADIALQKASMRKTKAKIDTFSAALQAQGDQMKKLKARKKALQSKSKSPNIK